MNTRTRILVAIAGIVAGIAVAASGLTITFDNADANPAGEFWAPAWVDSPSECVDWADGYNGRQYMYLDSNGYLRNAPGHLWRWKSYSRCILRNPLRSPANTESLVGPNALGWMYWAGTNDVACLPLAACNAGVIIDFPSALELGIES